MYNARTRTLCYVVQKRLIEFKSTEEEATLMLIRDPTSVEKAHMKVTEERYKSLLMSTVTHDLKTPLAEIEGQFVALDEFVRPEGEKHLIAARMATSLFRYYVYNLIVCLRPDRKDRTSISCWRELSRAQTNG
ncbi:MAG: hypothetical protein P4M11_08495 [Candidatus Pacebacteria bacterium]|nr:hypothetical protein [Candidatus Paceibacterota bacterium]